MVVNDKLNLTMLCDFYELTMSQGYFATGYKDRIAISICFSGAAPMAAASPLLPVWSRSFSISRICISLKRTLRTCVAVIFSVKNSWHTWLISSSPAISGPFPRALPCSPMSPLSLSVLLPSKLS